VGSYATAIREGRLEDAYRLLSQESRRDLSFAEFKTLIESSPQEVEALLREVEKQQAPPRVTAELTTRDGRTLLLIYEDGAWRIDESAVDIYGQSEPRQALRSFLLAYDNERYDVLLRFVPEAEAEGLTDKLLKEAWEGEQRLEIEQVVEALRPVVDNGNLEVLGEQASMSYGAGATVELVFEHGSWKIEDF
jgi:PAS domain-containing protein